MAPHKDHPTKTTSPRMNFLKNLTMARTGTDQEVKQRPSMAALDVGLHSIIKRAMGRWVDLMDMMRNG